MLYGFLYGVLSHALHQPQRVYLRPPFIYFDQALARLSASPGPNKGDRTEISDRGVRLRRLSNQGFSQEASRFAKGRKTVSPVVVKVHALSDDKNDGEGHEDRYKAHLFVLFSLI